MEADIPAAIERESYFIFVPSFLLRQKTHAASFSSGRNKRTPSPSLPPYFPDFLNRDVSSRNSMKRRGSTLSLLSGCGASSSHVFCLVGCQVDYISLLVTKKPYFVLQRRTRNIPETALPNSALLWCVKKHLYSSCFCNISCDCTVLFCNEKHGKLSQNTSHYFESICYCATHLINCVSQQLNIWRTAKRRYM